jgi:hypothetical protein
MIPLVIVCGKAGSGKDTVGDHLAKSHGGVCLGLADPMKRYMAEVFRFDDLQLYGPSEERNKIDPRYTRASDLGWELKECWNRMNSISGDLVRLFGNDIPVEDVRNSLRSWFQDCKQQAMERGGLSPRYVLQTFGTEWGRGLDPEVWSRLAINTARKILGGEHLYDRRGGLKRVPDKKRPPNLVVITDGRFANEIVNVKSAGGLAVHIHRPGATDTASTGVAGHSSEAGLDEVPGHFYDRTIINNGRVDSLKICAERLVRSVLSAATESPWHASTFDDLTLDAA